MGHKLTTATIGILLAIVLILFAFVYDHRVKLKDLRERVERLER